MDTSTRTSDLFELANRILKDDTVAEYLRSSPEHWIWGLFNAVLAAVPSVDQHRIPQAILICVTFLFSVLNPGYLEEHFRGPEFYSTPLEELRAEYDFVIGSFCQSRYSENKYYH